MRDHTLSEPFAVSEIFVDGFSDFVMQNGVMMCVGYRIQQPSHQHGDPQKIVVVRLVWPAAATDEAIADAKQAKNAPFFIGSNGERVRRH